VNKRELKVDILGVIISALENGNLNAAFKENLPDDDRNLAIEVENELANELKKIYRLNH